MALSDDLKFKLIVAGVGVLVVAYAAKRVGDVASSLHPFDAVTNAVSSAVDAVSNAAGEGWTFVANLPAATWQNMTTYADGQYQQQQSQLGAVTMPFPKSAWDQIPMGL
jgi:hypothetical protein